MSLLSPKSLVKEVADHLPVVIPTRDNMDAYNPVPVVSLPSVICIGGPTNQVIIGNIQGTWDPDILVTVITMVDVPVEEALDDILMNSIKVVIHLECDEKSFWMRSQV